MRALIALVFWCARRTLALPEVNHRTRLLNVRHVRRLIVILIHFTMGQGPAHPRRQGRAALHHVGTTINKKTEPNIAPKVSKRSKGEK